MQQVGWPRSQNLENQINMFHPTNGRYWDTNPTCNTHTGTANLRNRGVRITKTARSVRYPNLSLHPQKEHTSTRPSLPKKSETEKGIIWDQQINHIDEVSSHFSDPNSHGAINNISSAKQKWHEKRNIRQFGPRFFYGMAYLTNKQN